MAENIIDLRFDNYPIRAIDRAGDKWFVLVDVCGVLELSNPSMVASRLDPDEKNTLRVAEGIPGNPNVTVISLPGLLKLIQSSRVPKAREFDRWVRHEVLTEIDRTGSYRGTYDGAVIYQQISQLVAPMQADIRDLKFSCSVIPVIQADIAELKGSVGILTRGKRAFFSEPKVLRPVRQFVLEKHGGMCVNGCETLIVDEDAMPLAYFAADHWSGPQSNAIGNCYPTCQRCNLRLMDPATRARAAPRFVVFQEDLHRWLPGYRDRLKRAEADASPQFRFDLDQPGYADTSSLSVKLYRGFDV